MIYAVIATGPSMSQAVADSVRKFKTVAVNDAYRLAPWAEFLVAQDQAWWNAHPDALHVSGHKFSASYVQGVSRIAIPTNINSGLAGVMVAEQAGASVILLCGFDMRPGHYFGAHPNGLKNTDDLRFRVFRSQFKEYSLRCKAKVYNCTPDSALTCFPSLNLADVLERPAILEGGNRSGPGHWTKPHWNDSPRR